LRNPTFLIAVVTAACGGAGLNAGASVQLSPGQQARRLFPEGWHNGRLEYTADLLDSDKKAGRDSCLAINLHSGGLPFSVIIRERDSIEVWVPARRPGSTATPDSTSGHWVGVRHADVSGLACPSP